jgi:nucleoside-diphosphate-sugar epimerase
MTNQAVLLTGATGFIGRHMLRMLARIPDVRPVCIIREGERHPQAESLLNDGAIVFGGEFFDQTALQKAFDRHPIRQVVHLAAIRGGGNALPAEFERVNVKGTEILLQYAFQHRVDKFIFCSSVGVYGTIPTAAPAGLNTPLRGDSQYHQSKVAAEDAVQAYIRKGLNAYIVRPAITYGSGDNGFPHTLVQLVKRHLLFLPTVDHQIHLASVDRVTEVFRYLVLKNPCGQRIFVAADPEPVLFNDLVNWIHGHFYGRPYPSYLRLPDWSFRLALRLFERAGNERWAARIALLSNNWVYQCGSTYTSLGIQPVSTGEAFRLFLRDNFS